LLASSQRLFLLPISPAGKTAAEIGNQLIEPLSLSRNGKLHGIGQGFGKLTGIFRLKAKEEFLGFLD